MALDLNAVTRAVSGDLSAKLGVSADDAALGIRRIVDETMAAATRMHMAEKGRDPRRFTLIAFGGAGPVHACDLARLLKIKRVLVPLAPGLLPRLAFWWRRLRLTWCGASSGGWNGSIGRRSRRFTLKWSRKRAGCCWAPALIRRISSTSQQRICAMSAEALKSPVPMPSLTPGANDIAAIEQNFLAAYRERFGRALDGLPIEALTWRLAASAPGRDIAMEGAQKAEAGEAKRGSRRALFEGHGWCDCAVYDRYRLAPGAFFRGRRWWKNANQPASSRQARRFPWTSTAYLVIELFQS
jgi:N-methylhydantoinase A